MSTTLRKLETLFSCTKLAFLLGTSVFQWEVLIFTPGKFTKLSQRPVTKHSRVLVGFEVQMPLGGCNGVGFKKRSNPFFKNHTKRRNSKGCHLRSGDVIQKLAVAEVGVSSLGDRNTQDVSPIYRTHS